MRVLVLRWVVLSLLMIVVLEVILLLSRGWFVMVLSCVVILMGKLCG